MKSGILVFLLFNCFLSFSQEDNDFTVRANSFTVSPQIHSNFDETRLFSHPFTGEGASLPFGLSFIYERRYSELYALNIGFSGAYYRNPYQQEFSEYGTVASRTFTAVDVNFVKTLFKTSRHEFSRVFGGQFRSGREVLYDNYYAANNIGWNCIIQSNTLLDLGVNFGFQHKLFVGSRVSVSSQMAYTFYPLTYDYKNSWKLEDKGAARHLLALRVGASYHFGNLKKAPEDIGVCGMKDPPIKHSFSVYKSIYQFFDGSPMIGSKGNFAQFGPSIAGAYGISYQVVISDNLYRRVSFLSLAVEDFEFRGKSIFSDIKNGDVQERNFGLATVSYLRRILHGRKSHLMAQAGMSFRIGQELTIGERPASLQMQSYKHIQKDYRDFGIVAGLKYMKVLNYKKILGSSTHLMAKVNYTYLPYTLESYDPEYSWDKNPSRHMLSFSVGLGFNK